MAQERTDLTATNAMAQGEGLDSPRVLKKHLTALEKVFHAEIEGRLPAGHLKD